MRGASEGVHQVTGHAQRLGGFHQVTKVHRASEGAYQVTGGIWSLGGLSPGVHGALLRFLIPQAPGFRGAPRRGLGCPMASPRCGELPLDTCTIFCTQPGLGSGGVWSEGSPNPAGQPVSQGVHSPVSAA